MSAAEKKPEINVDPIMIDAFIDGVKQTLKTWANLEVEVGEASVQHPFESKGDIAGMVGLVFGDLKGTLTISFKENGLFKILGEMFGEEYNTLDDEVAGAAGEFTNTIYGIAIENMRGTKYDFKMSIPSVVVGRYKISKVHRGNTVIVPFKAEDIEFFFELTIEPLK